MAERTQASSKEMVVIGCIAGLAGFYFLLVGAGVLPVPGGPRNLHAPLWVVLAAGLAFFLAALPSFFRLSYTQTRKENSLRARHSGCVQRNI
jgi:hypothetical protein